MDKDIWDERRRGLEDGYFAKRDHEILTRLKAKQARDHTYTELSQLTGISDHYLLDRMLQLGITPQTAAALDLVPFVIVAWADGDMDTKERDAVLAAASAQGITSQHPAYELVAAWLAAPPDRSLVDLWSNHIASLKGSMDGAAMTKMRDDVLMRARAIAKAAGGFMGLGDKVSPNEERQLDQLAQVFDA